VPPETPAAFAPVPDRLAVVQLRFEIPHEVPIYAFTHAHPELTLIVIASQPVPGGRIVGDTEIEDPGQRDYSTEIAAIPGIVSVARTGELGARTRYQVVLGEPSYVALANELQTLLRYPRLIQNGEYTVEVAARVSQLRQLIDGLRRLSPSVRVLRFGRERMHTCPPTLTATQFALLQQALSAGYFDVPRRITLTRLAESLKRSKSSLSRSLALVERELAVSTVASLR
jgi:predicted DNA binding protein